MGLSVICFSLGMLLLILWRNCPFSILSLCKMAFSFFCFFKNVTVVRFQMDSSCSELFCGNILVQDFDFVL